MVIKKKGRIPAVCLAIVLILCSCGREESLTLLGAQELAAGGTEEGKRTAPREVLQGVENGAGKKEDKSIYVYVCGAVCTPGVYELPEGSRGDAALKLAGGFTDTAAVSSVNLAAVLQDGEKLYIPCREEVENDRLSERSDGRVNINLASLEELCTLPGIGASRAADIIYYREQNGSYLNCEDIMKVSGIKDSIYQKIKDKIKTE